MTRKEMVKDIVFVIPARLESTRLKHKMLIEFDGEPLIRIVFDKVRMMGYDTFVVTDSPKIAEIIPERNVIMTADAENGTARLSQLGDFLNEYENIINVQGDMIDISYETVKPFIDRIKNNYFVYTGYTKGYEPNGVKVIHQDGNVVYKI
jgi:3-deoxy-manno-octulosonate cytidylyltransferase (CMP-KDO synthetase)